jgi:hypothetical protein
VVGVPEPTNGSFGQPRREGDHLLVLRVTKIFYGKPEDATKVGRRIADALHTQFGKEIEVSLISPDGKPGEVFKPTG